MSRKTETGQTEYKSEKIPGRIFRLEFLNLWFWVLPECLRDVCVMSPPLGLSSKYTLVLLKAPHLGHFPFMEPSAGFHGESMWLAMLASMENIQPVQSARRYERINVMLWNEVWLVEMCTA